jgi:peptidoglycan hydrolase-like protein with peptidoglycan-binding domain
MYPEDEGPPPLSQTGVVKPWPLPVGDFFAHVQDSPHAHTGDSPDDVYSILTIQDQVGAELTGIYDEYTADAVRAWREFHGLTLDEDTESVVDQMAWEEMMRTEKDGTDQ